MGFELWTTVKRLHLQIVRSQRHRLTPRLVAMQDKSCPPDMFPVHRPCDLARHAACIFFGRSASETEGDAA